MKGLIIKEFLCIKNNMQSFFILLVIFAFAGFFSSYSNFVIVMIPSYSIMLVLSNFSYDEYNHFDDYCFTMPFKRRDIVGAKYIFVVLVLVISTLICAVISLIVPLWDSNLTIESGILSTFGAAFAISFLMSLTIPFIYKYGSQKGRIMVFVIVAGIGMFGGIILSFFKDAEAWIGGKLNSLENIANFGMTGSIVMMFVISAGILFLSYKISCRIYENK